MNILVTGGAGYIGSHTAKLLFKKGYKPLIFDNLTEGYKEAVKWGNLITGDLRDKFSIETAFQNFKIDGVVHFAASCLVGESMTKPAEYYQNNMISTFNLLEAMRKFKVNNLIFSSTCAVYGNPASVPITEDLPKNPINVYGKTKMICEELIKDYEEAYKIKNVIFRYFNAAGCDFDCETGEKHRPETHLIPCFMDYILGDAPKFSIFGIDYNTLDGTCIRDYIHVNDIAEAHILGLEYLLKENSKSQIFNLGNGNGYSVKDIINTIQSVSGLDKNPATGPRRIGDPPILIGDYSKAQRILSWEPKVNTIKEIVQSAWNFRKSDTYKSFEPGL